MKGVKSVGKDLNKALDGAADDALDIKMEHPTGTLDVDPKAPQDFGFSQIADNPEQLKLWNDTLKNMAAPGKSNAYTKYLDALESGKLDEGQAKAAYKAVRQEVGTRAKAEGVDFSGDLHHWNYNKDKYLEQVVNPANLSEPITHNTHLKVHQETTFGHSYKSPIKEEYELPINGHPIIIEGE